MPCSKNYSFFHCICNKEVKQSYPSGLDTSSPSLRQAQHWAMACGVNYSGLRAAEHQNDPICGSLYRVLWWRGFFDSPHPRGHSTEQRFWRARRTARPPSHRHACLTGNHRIETGKSSVRLSSFWFIWLQNPTVTASVRISALWWLLLHLSDLSPVRPGHSTDKFYKNCAAVRTRHCAARDAQPFWWLSSAGLQEFALIKIPRNHSLAKGCI